MLRGLPNEIQMPGTQPGQLPLVARSGVNRSLDSVKQCANCHSDFDPKVEPGHLWGGSMMSQAGRDPVFWATLAVAEQDFKGAGDICMRCHTSSGWLAGRATPSDGSALEPSHDGDGVECDTCHRLTDPKAPTVRGLQQAPFLAASGSGKDAHYGSGQYVMWPGAGKLGPYSDAVTRHPSVQSSFHRSSDLCGTCHDVSNPVTGDLAPGNGAQIPLVASTFSGVFGGPLASKAAFNNRPHQYGVVERTYSEHVSSIWPTLRVSDYKTLPPDLQAGAIKAAYEAAQAAGKGGDHEDGSPRFFTCQTCHMSPVVGSATSELHNRSVVRKDLPSHDLTGGNYWVPQAIKYLDAKDKLRLGGKLTSAQKAAMDDGMERARATLMRAGALKVSGSTVRVTNLTGHKLISGYPEGRRMWLNVKWLDGSGHVVKEDGAYGALTVTVNGAQRVVETLLDPHGSTRIYEVQGAVTREWASRLLRNGTPATLPLAFDRVTGKVTSTLGELAGGKLDHVETFHFILNNLVVRDNRIPPYGMRYAEAATRNALPVPASQFGAAKGSEPYRYYDDVPLKPPAGAARAEISLMYQPTSWEYIQFLYLANNRSSPTLAGVGDDLFEAWLETGMAKPQVMATAAWTAP